MADGFFLFSVTPAHSAALRLGEGIFSCFSADGHDEASQRFGTAVFKELMIIPDCLRFGSIIYISPDGVTLGHLSSITVDNRALLSSGRGRTALLREDYGVSETLVTIQANPSFDSILRCEALGDRRF